MSYLLETLGRGLLGSLYDAFHSHLPTVDQDTETSLLDRQAQSPTSADLAIRLGTLYLRSMRLGDSQEAFERALEINPNSREASIGLACIFDELGDLKKVIRCLSIATAQDPTDPAIAFAIGYCYERLGDTTAAVANYRHAVELHPHLKNGYERLAAIAVHDGNFADAIEEYSKLNDIEPEDLDIMTTLATLQLQHGDYGDAADKYQRALLVEPECESTLADADRLSQEGRLDEAIGAVEKLVNKFPGVPDFHVHLGDLYVKAGEQECAIKEYTTAIEYHPNFLEATIKLGTQQLRHGSFIDAAQSFAKAVELNDRLITAFVGLGVAQHESGFEAEAKATFDLAASLEPNSTLLFSETARLHFKSVLERRGQLEETSDTAEENREILSAAVLKHQQAILNNPNHADLHYRHGLLLRQLGHYKQAVQAFEAAIEINPNYTKAQIKLGVCLKEMGEIDQSIAAFRRAMVLEHNYVDVHYQLGLLFAQRNQFDLAAEEFKQAAEGNENNISFQANLALSLQNIGMVDRAKATWKSICDLTKGVNPVEVRRKALLSSIGES